MLRGLALTPPVLGRISIGRVVEKGGKRLPEMDDEFTITTQIQGRGGWIPHPVDESLRGAEGGKLRAIPVWLPFNDPDLVLRANYSMFDRKTGRPMCVGNGGNCRRSTVDGVKILPCPAPEACVLAESGRCKPYARMNVRIGDEDELGTFIFRTTGFNSIRTLAARLHYLKAVSGGLLAALPLELRLRGKSTTQSHGTPIFYVDLTTRQGASLAETLEFARAVDGARRAAGFYQEALDVAAREGFALGAFEESLEEGEAIVEEFYPEQGTAPQAVASASGNCTLGEKLGTRVSGIKSR